MILCAKMHYIINHVARVPRAKGRLFKYLVVVNETEVPGTLVIRSERMVRWRTGVCKNGGKAFPSSGGEQEASSELPLRSTFVSLSLSLSPFSLVSICPRLFPLSHHPTIQLPSSPYLDEVEKWFLLEKANEAFPSNISSSSSNVVPLFLWLTNTHTHTHTQTDIVFIRIYCD